MSITTNPRRIMRLPEVKLLTGFGRSHIYNLMKEGRFPKAKRTGLRAIGWDSNLVESWVADRLDRNGEA